ncbi:MAG TPA: hypothetical protein VM535_01735 [Candidatus Saccharimonadales bacterium]|nr:hypothetical protein [Candidatus Saccharimonadales bacterium]
MSLHKSKEREVAAVPTPHQMFTLAAATVCLAKDSGRKKASNYNERFHVLLPKSVESRVEDEEGEYSHHITHRYLGKVGRTGYRRWAMRLTEPYWISSEEETASYRSNYAFEWTHQSVVLATKKLTVEMSELDEAPDYGLQPVNFDIDMLQPYFLDAANQYETMSGADCSRLIDDVREFGAQSIRNVQFSH